MRISIFLTLTVSIDREVVLTYILHDFLTTCENSGSHFVFLSRFKVGIRVSIVVKAIVFSAICTASNRLKVFVTLRAEKIEA